MILDYMLGQLAFQPEAQEFLRLAPPIGVA